MSAKKKIEVGDLVKVNIRLWAWSLVPNGNGVWKANHQADRDISDYYDKDTIGIVLQSPWAGTIRRDYEDDPLIVVLIGDKVAAIYSDLLDKVSSQ